MRDKDMIRRGDALDCFIGLDCIVDIMDAIAALPAVTPATTKPGKEVMPDADQIGDSKPATSPGVTAGAAGLLDEVKAADRISDVDVAMLQSMATSFRARMGFSFNPDDMADLLTRVSAALARLQREVG